MPRSSRVASLCCLTAALVLGSCSSFDKRWNDTAMMPAANPAALMAGKWEGSWQSDATDYQGHLQAMIVATTKTVKDSKQIQQYAAEFRFRWQELGFDEYSVTLNAVKSEDGRLRFEGKKDVGNYKGGIIRYEGYVDSEKDVMYLDYISDKDCGTFKLHRLVGDNQ